MTGRPRKPTARKKIEGTYRPDRAPKNEAEPVSGVPPAPAWFTEGARREWDRLIPELEAVGLATGVDHWALVGYCESFDRYQELGEKIARMGEDRYQESASGWRQVQPEIAEQKQLLDTLCRLSGKLGISPSDRTKVEANPKSSAEEDSRMQLVK